MVNKTVKRNKIAARGVVILGTILASSAIWMSVVNSVKPVSVTSSPSSDVSLVITPSITNNDVASTIVQPAVPLQSMVTTQTTTPKQTISRLRTRGS